MQRMVLGREVHFPIEIAGLIEMAVLGRLAPGGDAAAGVIGQHRKHLGAVQIVE